MKILKKLDIVAVRYGFTQMLCTMVNQVSTNFFSVFLTSAVIGLTALQAGSTIAVASALDAVSLPIIGLIIQKVRLKGGYFRPYLLLGGAVVGIFRLLSFMPIRGDAQFKVFYYGATYLVAYIAYNFAFTAYNGTIPMMAKSPQQRVRLSAYRNALNTGGKFIFSLCAVPIITFFGRGVDGKGYTGLVAIIAVLTFFAFWQLWVLDKKFDYSSEPTHIMKGKSDENPSFFELLRYTITSRAFVTWTLASIVKYGASACVTSMAAYYYLYVIGSKAMYTVYLSATTGIMVVTSLFIPFVSKLVKGGRNTTILGVTWYGLCFVFAYFFGKTDVSFTAIMVAAYVGYSLFHGVGQAVFSSVAEYTEWKTGKDMKGFIMGFSSIAAKFSSAVGGLVVGIGLTAIGFNAEAITPEVTNGIRALMSLLPAVVCAVSVGLTFLCPLTDKNIKRIQQELEERRQEKEAKCAAE